MAVTVRKVTDWLKLGLLLALLVTAGIGVLAAQSESPSQPQSPVQSANQTPSDARVQTQVQTQSQYDITSQKANERIQELAALARTSTTDPPVGPGDLLHVDVFDVPELSRDVRVSNSGVIRFPLVPDDIPVSGLTPAQVEQTLTQVLSANGLVAHAQVSVFVKEETSQPVIVMGAVGHPVVMQITKPTSLIELLAQCGGITDEAGAEISITRQKPPVGRMVNVSDKTADDAVDPASQTETISIRLQDLLESGNVDYNIQVHGGDIVSVPRAGIIYVLGYGIAQQGEYVMQAHGDQVTALKAVALAHGLTGFAKADSAVIMRTDPTTGKRAYIPVHLKQIQKHKEDDVPMMSNDILYVPDSRSKKALAEASAAAVGIGTGIAIYHIAP